MFRLDRRLAEEIIAHARQEDPDEVCGILAGPPGEIRRLYRATNGEPQPTRPIRYNIAAEDLLRITRDIEAHGWEVVGIYHSHTHTQAYPSATDVNQAFWPDTDTPLYPGCIYVLVSLEFKAYPLIRAFRIVSRQQIDEEEVVIVG